MKSLKRNIIFVFLTVLVLSASGCMITPAAKYDAAAFSKTPTFAIVTIYANEKIMGPGMGGGGTITGAVKAATSKEHGFKHPTDKIFNATKPIIVSEIRKSKHFKLLPENKVLKSKAYKAIEGDEPKFMFAKFKMAKGYKYFKGNRLKDVAKALNVDAVILVNVTYNYTSTGVNLAGIVAAGNQMADVMIGVSAVNKNGDTVWSDVVRSVSDEKVRALSDAVNFTKLHPLLVDATKSGIREIMDKLNKNL